MNYYQSDFAISQAALLLNKQEDADILLQRTYNYSLLFDPSYERMRSKSIDTLEWTENFDLKRLANRYKQSDNLDICDVFHIGMMRQRSTSKSRWLRIAEVNMRIPTCPSCSVHVQWSRWSDGNLRLHRPVLAQKDQRDLYSSLSSMVGRTMEKCQSCMYCLVWDHSLSWIQRNDIRKSIVRSGYSYRLHQRNCCHYQNNTQSCVHLVIWNGKIFLVIMESNVKYCWNSQWEINLFLHTIE